MSKRSSRFTAWAAVATVAAMVGLSFAAVPLYRAFCQITGFAGTPRLFAAAPSAEIDRSVTVSFSANVARGMPWTFSPAQGPMTVKLGETAMAEFRARNDSTRPIVGVATFNVTPFKVGEYFAKIACFCFNEQRLEPGEEVLMPVTFYVDPAFATDRSTSDVTNVTLSYTFFEADDSPRAPESRDGTAVVN